MTPDEFNQLVETLTRALEGRPGIGVVSTGSTADDQGTMPEIYVEVQGADLCLTVTPL